MYNTEDNIEEENLDKKVDRLFSKSTIDYKEKNNNDSLPSIKSGYEEEGKRSFKDTIKLIALGFFSIFVCYFLWNIIGTWTIFVAFLFILYIFRSDRFFKWLPRILIIYFIIIVTYALYLVFGYWIIVSSIFAFVTIFVYTFFIYEVPSVLVVDNVHNKAGFDKFSIFVVPLKRWYTMVKEGDSNPLEIENGICFFTEGIDFEENMVSVAPRHHSNFDFDTKHDAFFDLKEDYVSESKKHLIQRLLHDVDVHKEIKSRMNYFLNELDSTIFKDNSIPKNDDVSDIELRINELEKKIFSGGEKLESVGEKPVATEN